MFYRTSLTTLYTILLFSSTSYAITGRDDYLDDNAYRNLGNDPLYQSCCYVETLSEARGSGVLVSPQWVLTAAHVAENGIAEIGFGASVSEANSSDIYTASGIIRFPEWYPTGRNSEYGWDIALVRLSTPVLNVTPAQLYSGSSEVGGLGVWTGYGRGGNGADGYDDYYGVKRGAENFVDLRGTDYEPILPPLHPDWHNDRILFADFDSPHIDLFNRMGSSTPQALEGCIAPGDSGGGVYANIEGINYLIGINSFTWPNGSMNKYNTAMAATAVSPFNSWINGIISDNMDTLTYTYHDYTSFLSPYVWVGQRLDLAIPTAADTVRFIDPENNITFSADVVTRRALIESGNTIFDLQGHTYTLTYDGEDGAMEIGTISGGNARLSVCGGILSIPSLRIATSVGGSGLLVLEAGGVDTKLYCQEMMIVGERGNGTYIQTGGTNTTNKLVLGYDSGSEGSCSIFGGELKANYAYVGYGLNSNGTFDLNGGTATLGYLSLGWGGNGTWTQSGGTLDVQNYNIDIGGIGTGTFNFNGGTVIADKIDIDANGTFATNGSGNLTVNRITGSWSDISVASFTLGHSGGCGEGSMSLASGQSLSAATFTVGRDAPATFIQTGGTIIADDVAVYVDYYGFSNGRYELSGSGQIQATSVNVGCADEAFVPYYEPYHGEGIFNQTGGNVTISADLSIGGNGYWSWVSQNDYPQFIPVKGSYKLSGMGQLITTNESIGCVGDGEFTQTGGVHIVDNHLKVGGGNWQVFEIPEFIQGTGRYALSGAGNLQAWTETIGDLGIGVFSQSGGVHTVADKFSIGLGGWQGSWWGGPIIIQGSGNYILEGNGQLQAGSETIGEFGIGVFSQNGGTHTVAQSISIGMHSGDFWDYLTHEPRFVNGEGTYILNAGSLSAASITLGVDGGTGRFEINGGTLDVGSFDIGGSGSGILEIGTQNANITISEKMTIGPYGSLSAVPGATIHMTGSTFENHNTDPTALAGLANLTMIFEGGDSVVDSFEIAGDNLGATLDGFNDNFALGTLQLGGDAGIGQVMLVDLFDNQQDGLGNEALYVYNLVLNDGSFLDLNGFDLYYASFTNFGGIIDLNGGHLFAVPEPSVLILLGISAISLLFYTRIHRCPRLSNMFGRTILGSMSAVVVLTCCTIIAQEVSIDLVTIGNPGNENDSTGYGSVVYPYLIGKYEVNAGQYTEFLNAKSLSDPHGLYCTYMDTSVDTMGCNIKRSGADGCYFYSVAPDWANRPVNYVSFWDGCRFINWLHNGQGDGDTETGAYTLDGYNGNDGRDIARNVGATWFLPSENEWYKAAYHKNDGVTGNYFDYPTSSDTFPSNVLGNPSDPGNNATFPDNGFTIGDPYYRTEVGAHENSDSPYGTFDQGGNVWEWNEAVVPAMPHQSDQSLRGVRGGFFGGYWPQVSVWDSAVSDPTYESCAIGFRVAYIPEPGTIVMLISAIVGLLALAKMRRSNRLG